MDPMKISIVYILCSGAHVPNAMIPTESDIGSVGPSNRSINYVSMCKALYSMDQVISKNDVLKIVFMSEE